MSSKQEVLFRVSCIVQDAENLDSVLRAINGLTVHPPLTEPYQEPLPKPKPLIKPGKITVRKFSTLKELITSILQTGEIHQSDLGKELKNNGYSSRSNVSKVARQIGAQFNPHTKTWSLPK